MEIIIAICALAAGFLLGIVTVKAASSRKDDGFEKLAAEKERQYKESLAFRDEQYADNLKMAETHNQEMLRLQDERHREALEALRRQFEETVNTMSEQLKNVTEEMLRQRQMEFADSSRDKINQLIQPLQSSIKEMKEAVAANTTRHTELGGKLDASLTNLLAHTVAAQTSAEKLADALKGSNRIQGEWGETVLRELLESQGLQEGIHFHTQTVIQDSAGKSIVNAEGNTMRPDIVLHLDKTRDVIIDSKVSLSAYLEYINAADEATRKNALDAHIRSIEAHVAELVRKDYSGYAAEGKTPLGYVIMFVPNTSALLLATSGKPALWRNAMEKKVYIADEQTLYAALKIVNMTWQQIAQATNHEKVYALAQEMLDRVGTFMQRYTEIGSRLQSAVKSYEEGMAKLKEGGQSIPGTCRKLINLGAKPRKAGIKGVSPDLLGLEDSN